MKPFFVNIVDFKLLYFLMIVQILTYRQRFPGSLIIIKK